METTYQQLVDLARDCARTGSLKKLIKLKKTTAKLILVEKKKAEKEKNEELKDLLAMYLNADSSDSEILDFVKGLIK